MIEFKKAVKDHEEHLSKWQERGLAVADQRPSQILCNCPLD